MAKKNSKKKPSQKNPLLRFITGMLVYAVIFMTAVGFGMAKFWDFMEAYEASRPSIAINAYMEQLTREHIVDSCADLIAQVDHNIQSEEECRQVLMDALSGELTYARKASECTEDMQVYVLRSGRQVIGSFTIETTGTDKYNFTRWRFSSENFDLSFLLTCTDTAIVAPEEYPVVVNGVKLNDDYVTEKVVEEFKTLEDYYENFDLPMFVLKTYKVGPFLGEISIEVTDLNGDAFEYDPETFDQNVLIHNCSADEEAELDEFVSEFIKRYVLFTGCSNDARFANYHRLMELVVEDSNLAQRMYDALDGLEFAQSKGDKVVSIVVNHHVKLQDGCYMMDVTYLVDTIGHQGVVQITNHVKILVVENEDKLLVESIVFY